ncbi:MAG: hypothetical protein QOF84_802 [Streptomyces sp.]|jgi:hypothetical protein|nr:hypothetical protein [Streptomyces sp.]
MGDAVGLAAEFAADAEMLAFTPGIEVVAEVTADPRFTGGRLARTSREELLAWLAEFRLVVG